MEINDICLESEGPLADARGSETKASTRVTALKGARVVRRWRAALRLA